MALCRPCHFSVEINSCLITYILNGIKPKFSENETWRQRHSINPEFLPLSNDFGGSEVDKRNIFVYSAIVLHHGRRSAGVYKSRTLEIFFKKATSQFPVMLVTGARQVGKTTLLQHLCETDRAYVTLDDPMVLSLAREDPALFMQRFPPPVLIDEIQYAPGLLPYIKLDVDKQKKSGLYWLTGSQQFHLMKGVSETLAGRVGIVNLLGMSNKECHGQNQMSPFLPTTEELAAVWQPAKPFR